MSNFIEFKEAMQKHIESIIKDQDVLFLTDIEKDVLWGTYLESFPEGTNNIYKERKEYDCNCCRQFIRAYGNIVVIKNNKLISIWDIPLLEQPFITVANKLSKLVKKAKIKNVFITKFAKLGTNNNKQLLENGSILNWEHFYFEIPKKFIDTSSDSIESVQGTFRDNKNVFKRSMEELTLDAGNNILELIDQKSLYKGEEFQKAVKSFISYKSKYINLSEKEKDIWCWVNSFNNPISKIRNTAIGTLLINLSEGIELDVAVSKFEKVVAPTNYKRPKAIFTKKMIEDAQKTIEELGFSESLSRKHAVLTDITINNVLFVNRDAKKKITGNIFDELKEDVAESPKKFNKVEEVSIEDFITKIVPSATNIELMMENRHQNNLMSLIAPDNKKASSMLKWNNNFSWSYNGDITDSMKQRVKSAGGNVEGELRFSIQWNDLSEWNRDDFDAHCIEPCGNIISYSNMHNYNTTGILDVDIMNPDKGIPAVENITWSNRNKMNKGVYKLLVHNYSHRNGKDGFAAEIEFDGQVYSFEYRKSLKQNEKVMVAKIEFDGTNFKIIKSLDSSMSSKEIWGVKTNKFTKVSVAMFSPNYWDEQKGIGNKHYFFFMDECKTENSPRGFYNEFLKESLTKHKRVFEALGNKMKVEPSENQLSGLGFSSTQRNSIVAKINGSFSRIIKINF